MILPARQTCGTGKISFHLILCVGAHSQPLKFLSRVPPAVTKPGTAPTACRATVRWFRSAWSDRPTVDRHRASRSEEVSSWQLTYRPPTPAPRPPVRPAAARSETNCSSSLRPALRAAHRSESGMRAAPAHASLDWGEDRQAGPRCLS